MRFFMRHAALDERPVCRPRQSSGQVASANRRYALKKSLIADRWITQICIERQILALPEVTSRARACIGVASTQICF